MSKILTRAACAAGLATAVMVVPAVTGTTTAEAATVCTHNWIRLGWWGVTTTPQVAATNTCKNMWSEKMAPGELSNWVKGRYKNSSGVWVDSTAGWKWTTVDSHPQEIVLDLDPGEPLRAFVRNNPYNTDDRASVRIWY